MTTPDRPTNTPDAAAERLIANSWDVYIPPPQLRNWMKIADTVLQDGRAVARAYLTLRAVGTPDAGANVKADANLVCRECRYAWLPEVDDDNSTCPNCGCGDPIPDPSPAGEAASRLARVYAGEIEPRVYDGIAECGKVMLAFHQDVQTVLAALARVEGELKDYRDVLEVEAGLGDEARQHLAAAEAKLAEVEERIALAGGYHERTEREIEIEAALDQTPPDARDPADVAIGELLVMVDAGRNRVHEEIEKREKLQAFKTWVHDYLDSHGVPHHPPGTHGAAGCRIGDRMDWLMAHLSAEREKRRAAEAKLALAERERDGIIDHLPSALVVRVREGGGPENRWATLAASVAGMWAKLAAPAGPGEVVAGTKWEQISGPGEAGKETP